MCSAKKAADLAHTRYAAARGELLAAVAALAASDEWRGDGAVDLASWLAPRWQIALRTAREYVRDAEALTERPALGDALRDGAVSADQCKALSVLCEAGTDDVWLENLPFWSLPELEREARKEMARKLERRDGGTYFRMRHTSDERFMKGEFQLHPEDGAILLAAVEARIPSGTTLRDWDAASADALIELAKGSTSGGIARPTVLMSVNDRQGVGELRSGGLVAQETASRVACDANLQLVHHDEDGKIAAIEPAKAAVAAAVRRAVEQRDGHMCTFPGCQRRMFLECHHIVHRAHGGSNEPSNLQLVCWRHHRLVHEYGWSLGTRAGPRNAWIRPDGTPLEPRVRVALDTS